jgi:hypothetical protein
MNEYELRLQRERMSRVAAQERYMNDRQRKRSNRVWLMIIVLSGLICLGGQHLVFKYEEQGAREGVVVSQDDLK